MERKLLIYSAIIIICLAVLYVTADEFKGVKIIPTQYADYSDQGLSFKYPSDWKLNSTLLNINYPDYKIEPVVTLTRPDSGSVPLTFSVFLVDENVSAEKYGAYMNSLKTVSRNLVSVRNLTVDGIPAYESVERIGEGQTAIISFLKDGKQYEIRLFVPDGIYPKNKNIQTIRAELDTILQSFKITNSGEITLNKYVVQK